MAKNTKIKYVNGVNPEALAKWKAEDKQERVEAFKDLCRALWKLEQLYEVPSESDHPLEQAYTLIYDFGEAEGINE